MGRFPIYESSNPLNTGSPVQGEDPRLARVPHDALTKLAEETMKFSEGLATEQAESALNASKVAAEEANIEAEKESKADGSDFAQLLKEKYAVKSSAIRAEMDPLVMGKAALSLEQLDAQIEITGLRTGFQKKVEHFQVVSEDNTRIAAGNVLNHPELAAEYLDDNIRKFQEHSEKEIPIVLLDKMKRKADDTISAAYVEGMVNRGALDPNSLLQLKRELGAMEEESQIQLSSDDMKEFGLMRSGVTKIGYTYPNGSKVDAKMSEVLRAMRPEVRAAAFDKIQKQLEAHTKVKMKDIDRIFTNFEANAERGEPSSADNRLELRSKLMQVPAELRPEYKARYDILVDIDTIVAESIYKGATSANAMLEQHLPLPTDSINVKARKFQVHSKVTKALEVANKMRVEDPTRFVHTYDRHFGVADAYALTADGDPQATTDYITKLHAAQRAMRVPVSILSAGEAHNIMGKIDSAVALAQKSDIGHAAIEEVIVGINKQYREHAPEVFHDLVKLSGNKTPTLALLNHVSPDQQRIVIKNIGNKQKILTDFSDKSKVDAAITTEVNQMLSIQNADMLTKMFGNSRHENNMEAAAISEEIELRTKQAILQGVHQSTAFSNAVKGVTANYHELRTGKNIAFMPSGKGYNEKLAQTFINNNLPTATSSTALRGGDAAVELDPAKRAIMMKAAEKARAAGKPNQFDLTIVNPKAIWSFEQTSAYDPSASLELRQVQRQNFGNNARIISNTTGIQLVMVRLNPLTGQEDIVSKVATRDGKPAMISWKDLNRYNAETGGFNAPAPLTPAEKEQILRDQEELRLKQEKIQSSAANTVESGDYEDYYKRSRITESDGNDGARNPEEGQTATGRYQFIKSTWDALAQDPALELDSYDEGGPLVPEQQERAMRKFTMDNANAITELGIAVSPATLRIMHNLGGPMGTRLMQSEPNAKLMDLFEGTLEERKHAMAVNHWDEDMTVAQYLQLVVQQGYSIEPISDINKVPAASTGRNLQAN